ncbi:ABC transporter substrate-binding protein [Eudoraea sp.]|uniref:ABC transporter substrate-binding protein n=1 Tax=Eudoraea sp. TaxID=1979955 RepID=UPI003C7166FE
MKNYFLKSSFVVFMISCFLLFSCSPKQEKKNPVQNKKDYRIDFAKGFSINTLPSGITIINVNAPWPDANRTYSYALVKRGMSLPSSLEKRNYDAIIPIPVERIIATSTTHIAALEALGVENSIVGFPDMSYISSKATRKRINKGLIKEMGKNESLNTELAIELAPDVIFGFSINSQNTIYKTLTQSNIPIVYNGDWTEQTPLGKAEWIRFFAPFYGLEKKGDSIFQKISKDYELAKTLALKATKTPTVLSGALYKDVWYLPGGKSWAAKFIEDANADYIWNKNEDTGSLSLSVESVLEKASEADIWISPSQFISYEELGEANRHYERFKAFKQKKIFTFANTKGETGGLLYYEIGPGRPDLVLKDLIHIFHPELLSNYQPYFFKPLE